MHFFVGNICKHTAPPIPLHAELTQLKKIMHRYESYVIVLQLVPWLHKTAGHAIVALFIMKIKCVDSEEMAL